MHEGPINQLPLPRIRRYISKLSPKILPIANPMLMNARLPHFSGKLFSDFMRKPALDALRATLNRLILSRAQQDVQMFRHHNEPVQSVSSLIPIMKERLDQQPCIYRSNEERTSLVSRGSERIGFHD
jgi:hypothetical protein